MSDQITKSPNTQINSHKDEVLVSVQNVSKKFCRDLKTSLWYGVKDLTSEFFGRSKDGELRPKEFYAVNDVSFELRRGECLGLIGHNGAGKSTLLKMLNGLIKPDKGTITMKGRIGALIELGAGFNPILTGRENIYINGAVLGFNKKEIDEKFDAIVEFSEIGDFIDTPVRNYSSGMKVRLGFAVAAQMEPDILLIDEVLAVGDVGFQVKCFNTIEQLVAKSAVIFVSHNMAQVAKVATLGIQLISGKVSLNTKNISELISGYYDISEKEEIICLGEDILLDNLKINNHDISEQHVEVPYLEDLNIQFSFFPKFKYDNLEIIVVIFDRALRPIAFVNSNTFQYECNKVITIKLNIPQIQFSIGNYSLGIQFGTKKLAMANESRQIISYYRNIGRIKIIGEQPINHAFFQLKGKWQINI